MISAGQMVIAQPWMATMSPVPALHPAMPDAAVAGYRITTATPTPTVADTDQLVSGLWRPQEAIGRNEFPSSDIVHSMSPLRGSFNGDSTPLIKAFIFDNDGVVINSEPIIFEATARVFLSYGIRLSPEDVQKGIGAGSEYVQIPKEKYGLVDVSVEKLMAAREREFRILAHGRLHPFPGFFALMKLLKERGILTALASSASTDVVYHNLSLANIDFRLFDNIVDSARIKNKKPFPDIFLAAAKNLRVPPSNCLVIEDAPPGIEAAHRAGMRVVATSTSLPKSFLHDSDHIVDSIEDIIGMLDKLVRGASHENG